MGRCFYWHSLCFHGTANWFPIWVRFCINYLKHATLSSQPQDLISAKWPSSQHQKHNSRLCHLATVLKDIRAHNKNRHYSRCKNKQLPRNDDRLLCQETKRANAAFIVSVFLDIRIA